MKRSARHFLKKLLLDNKVYIDILLETKASTSTISRVKRMVTGGTGCIKKVIERMDQQEDAL